jgi:hypothetical protein
VGMRISRSGSSMAFSVVNNLPVEAFSEISIHVILGASAS